MRNSLSRREFLQLAGAAGAILTISGQIAPLFSLTSACAATTAKKRVFSGSRPGTSFTKFIDPLPLPTGFPRSRLEGNFIHRTHSVTRLVARWAPPTTPLRGPGSAASGVNLYPFDPTRGRYVWHCHNLQPEDNEMMRPYRVSVKTI